MSHARDRIVEVLSRHYSGAGYSLRFEGVADELMVVVRDTVAEGFDTAASIFGDLEPQYDTAAELLRQWATDARVANHKPAED